jgi:hypothetical protein
MPRQRPPRRTEPETLVTFRLDDRTYQIDTDRRKVYRGFVEIETSRAVWILAQWRAQGPGA